MGRVRKEACLSLRRERASLRPGVASLLTEVAAGKPLLCPPGASPGSFIRCVRGGRSRRSRRRWPGDLGAPGRRHLWEGVTGPLCRTGAISSLYVTLGDLRELCPWLPELLLRHRLYPVPELPTPLLPLTLTMKGSVLPAPRKHHSRVPAGGTLGRVASSRPSSLLGESCPHAGTGVHLGAVSLLEQGGCTTCSGPSWRPWTLSPSYEWHVPS